MKLTLSTFSILLILLLAPFAYAESTKIVLSPSVTKIVAKPNTKPVFNITLENKGDPMVVKLNVAPIEAADNSGHIRLSKPGEKEIKFTIKNPSFSLNRPFVVKSQFKETFTIEASIPADLPANDYYFITTFDTTPFPASEGESTVQFSTTVGANVLFSITPDGYLENNLSVPLFTIPKGYSIPFLNNLILYDTSDTIPVIIMVKNNGRNLINSKAILNLTGWNLKKAYSLKSQNILKHSQRIISDSRYCNENCSDNSSLSLKQLFIGKYTLSSTISAENSSSKITKTVSFIALPFKSTILLALLCFVAYFIKRLKK